MFQSHVFKYIFLLTIPSDYHPPSCPSSLIPSWAAFRNIIRSLLCPVEAKFYSFSFPCRQGLTPVNRFCVPSGADLSSSPFSFLLRAVRGQPVNRSVLGLTSYVNLSPVVAVFVCRRSSVLDYRLRLSFSVHPFSFSSSAVNS